jgi:hypothetical protein
VRKKHSARRLSFEEVITELADESPSVLLGNGFSIACDDSFNYASLYQRAVEMGLDERAQRVFDRLGTNNFEGAMRLLDECLWVNDLYECCASGAESLIAANESIKTALIAALSASHLDDQNLIREGGVPAANHFLSRFPQVFTTNYDLLSYWADMHHRPHDDGFREDPNDPESESLVFDGSRHADPGFHFLHGAIHLFTEHNEIRKHSFCRSGKKLTALVEEGLERQRYPLFVAEGSSEKKQRQIDGNHYLSHCLERFRRTPGPLVVFGFSFDQADAHIMNAIVANGRIQRMYVSYYGDFNEAENAELQARVHRIQKARDKERKPLSVSFFDSSEAEVWGGNACRSVSGW